VLEKIAKDAEREERKKQLGTDGEHGGEKNDDDEKDDDNDDDEDDDGRHKKEERTKRAHKSPPPKEKDDPDLREKIKARQERFGDGERKSKRTRRDS
jgi:hypothetical protein